MIKWNRSPKEGENQINNYQSQYYREIEKDDGKEVEYYEIQAIGSNIITPEKVHSREEVKVQGEGEGDNLKKSEKKDEKVTKRPQQEILKPKDSLIIYSKVEKSGSKDKDFEKRLFHGSGIVSINTNNIHGLNLKFGKRAFLIYRLIEKPKKGRFYSCFKLLKSL